MSALSRLSAWYQRQCNEEWEHTLGVQIESCDNPGWWVKINIQGTRLETVSFTRLAENVDAQGFPQAPRWLDCSIRDGVWNGAGDETRLEQIVELFLDWAEQHDS